MTYVPIGTSSMANPPNAATTDQCMVGSLQTQGSGACRGPGLCPHPGGAGCGTGAHQSFTLRSSNGRIVIGTGQTRDLAEADAHKRWIRGE